MSQGTFFLRLQLVTKSHCSCFLFMFSLLFFALPPFRLILSFILDGWITGGTVILLCLHKP